MPVIPSAESFFFAADFDPREFLRFLLDFLGEGIFVSLLLCVTGSSQRNCEALCDPNVASHGTLRIMAPLFANRGDRGVKHRTVFARAGYRLRRAGVHRRDAQIARAGWGPCKVALGVAGLGGAVVVLGIAELPWGVLRQKLSANPSPWRSVAPSRLDIANLIELKTFDGVRWTIESERLRSASIFRRA